MYGVAHRPPSLPIFNQLILIFTNKNKNKLNWIVGINDSEILQTEHWKVKVCVCDLLFIWKVKPVYQGIIDSRDR